MFHIVCLTKSYNWEDLYTWFNYHDKMGYFIHLIDNESISEIANAFKPMSIPATAPVEGIGLISTSVQQIDTKSIPDTRTRNLQAGRINGNYLTIY